MKLHISTTVEVPDYLLSKGNEEESAKILIREAFIDFITLHHKLESDHWKRVRDYTDDEFKRAIYSKLIEHHLWWEFVSKNTSWDMSVNSEDNKESITLIKQLIREVEKHQCAHEETIRGGSIWTICTQCDRKWADDEGGFQPDPENKVLKQAYKFLDKHDIHK